MAAAILNSFATNGSKFVGDVVLEAIVSSSASSNFKGKVGAAEWLGHWRE